MPGDCAGRAAGANTASRATHTRARRGKPAKPSQIPTPTLRNSSAPHRCKAQQAWAAPDNGDSRGTGSESLIHTYAASFSFFLFFFLSSKKSRFASKPAFPQEAGACSEGSASRRAGSCGLPRMRTGRRAAMPLCLPQPAPTASTPAPGAPSDVNTHELRAVLWDKA